MIFFSFLLFPFVTILSEQMMNGLDGMETPEMNGKISSFFSKIDGWMIGLETRQIYVYECIFR